MLSCRNALEWRLQRFVVPLQTGVSFDPRQKTLVRIPVADIHQFVDGVPVEKAEVTQRGVQMQVVAFSKVIPPAMPPRSVDLMSRLGSVGKVESARRANRDRRYFSGEGKSATFT